ncbi:MAG: molybdopterin biosynthesis protein MoeA [Synergistaceae bacterium]|jgi:putative molybdopterin biosynthesis protein|nr:molybdopterin biosynthesis protein MoeA [Synergistaceae bacterium]
MAVVRPLGYPEHCSLDEALKILLDEFTAAPKRQRLRARDALGFTLCDDVYSRRNVPHYAASAVDGYAVQSGATPGATAATPVCLGQGDFSWVNTGMPIGGYDSVIMVEDTSMVPAAADGGTEARRLKIFRSLTQGENVRAVGEDVMNGQLIACRGDSVTSALVSLMLCAGVEEVSVRARPRTLFMPTGDEIVSGDEWLSDGDMPPGLVVDSNSLYAKSAFASWGYGLDVSPILPDDPDAIKEAVRRAAREYDLVLVSAGSAKGSRDHSADILSGLGRMLFRYVRMKPGRPVMAADIGGTPVIVSPGFPMSCAVTLWSIVYPILKRLSGEAITTGYVWEAIASAETVAASLMIHHSSPQGVTEWLRVKCAHVDGKMLCWPLTAGASVLWALAEADGIAKLPEETLECPRGTGVSVHMTKRVDFSRRLLFQGSDDPAVGLLIPIMREMGFDLAIRAVGSMGGLAALGRGEAHLAAAHLLDPADGTYNTGYIARFSEGRGWRRLLIFHREQGIITAPGNPKGIRGFESLASGEAVFENRQPGAGTRVLLDYMLKENGLSAASVRGYDRISITHLEAANKVASGVADATLGIASAAAALGLHFIPIAREPYELVFSEGFLAHLASGALISAIGSREWRRAVTGMGGYALPPVSIYPL